MEENAREQFKEKKKEKEVEVMNWKREAIDNLKHLRHKTESIQLMKKRISALEEDVQSPKNSNANPTPVSGGMPRQEENWINNIMLRDNLRKNVMVVQSEVEAVNIALRKLPEELRLILITFYVDRPERYIDILCERFGREKTRIYELKDEALIQFTYTMYGALESH